MVLEGGQSAETVVQSTDNGVRFLSVIKDAQAPTSYEYRIPSATLTKNADGSVSVQAADGSRVGILPAWALDATGASVPTEYEVRGDVLVQNVRHAGFAYPVVADPAFSNCLVRTFIPGTCVKWNRTETTRLYNNAAAGAGAGSAAGAACSYIPSSPAPIGAIKIACGAAIASKFADYTSSLNSAHSQRKCLEMRISTLSLVATDFRVANC